MTTYTISEGDFGNFVVDEATLKLYISVDNLDRDGHTDVAGLQEFTFSGTPSALVDYGDTLALNFVLEQTPGATDSRLTNILPSALLNERIYSKQVVTFPLDDLATPEILSTEIADDWTGTLFNFVSSHASLDAILVGQLTDLSIEAIAYKYGQANVSAALISPTVDLTATVTLGDNSVALTAFSYNFATPQGYIFGTLQTLEQITITSVSFNGSNVTGSNVATLDWADLDATAETLSLISVAKDSDDTMIWFVDAYEGSDVRHLLLKVDTDGAIVWSTVLFEEPELSYSWVTEKLQQGRNSFDGTYVYLTTSNEAVFIDLTDGSVIGTSSVTLEGVPGEQFYAPDTGHVFYLYDDSGLKLASVIPVAPTPPVDAPFVPQIVELF